MRERNSFTCLFLRTIVYAVLLSAVALGQIRIQKSIRINPGISTDDAPPTRLHYNGYLHDLYVEFTITPADMAFQPLLWLWWAPEWTDYYGVPIPGQMDAIEEYRPQLNTYVEEYLGQGYFAVAPEHGGGNPTNYPYTLSARAFVDGIRIWGLGMPGDSLICDSANFDVYYDYYDNGMPCHSFWNVCWEFYIFNLSTFDKPLTDRITQGKVNDIRFDGEVIDHRVSTPPPYWCPVVDPVTATIIKGDKYAHLCTETDTASQITGLAYQEALYLEVDRDVPDTADKYCVVQTSTRNFTRTDTVYYLPHDTIFVTCEPKQLYTGDTAVIHMHQRSDGVVDTNEYFDSREIGILGNDYYGTLLDEWGDTATYFGNVTGQLQFIAAQDLDADSVCAKIRVGLAPPLPMCSVVPEGPVPRGKEEKKPMVAVKTKNGEKKFIQVMNKQSGQKTKNTESKITALAERVKPTNPKGTRGAKPAGLIKKSGKIKDIQFLYTQAGSDSIPVKSADILLGQTKYYWATEDPDDDSKLIIQESETDPSQSVPPGIADVNFSVTKNANDDKLGVYYEYKNDKGNDLGRNWFIRIIGRYWSPAKTYKAHLYATTLDGQRSGDISIEVKKPIKLYNLTSSPPWYNEAWNIRDEWINIDSICIWYGGNIGIPPQVIKGQMYQESYREAGNFWPCYRYEPWADYNFVHNNAKANSKAYMRQPFWITGEAGKMGEGKVVPLDHKNVKPLYYPTDPISIANYVLNNNNWNMYFLPSKDSIIGSGELTSEFRNYLAMFSGDWELLSSNEQFSLAQTLIETKILLKYTDYAQTRKAASYGFIQMLYTTALVQGYNAGESITSSSAPEELNDELIEMPLYQEFTEKNLGLRFSGDIPDSQWPDGWENTWMKSFKKYNNGKGYAASVFKNAKMFYPQSN